MNGALYISFFQGQLESALEQVVQLAVQEITKTVGASLNSMLLETAAKDQENQRLRLKLQLRALECTAHGKASASNGGREANAATEGTKPEQHTPSQSTERGVQSDTLRLEQKGRVVGQLKVVMEQVLEFAACELTKIVEDSFDDLLLELTKKERENQALQEWLRGEKDMVEVRRGSVTAAKECENDSDFPSSSEGVRQELLSGQAHAAKIVRGKERTETTNEADKQTVLTVTQDWVPILDKVFGQKWCSDLWQINELASGKGEGGTGPGSGSTPDMDRFIREALEPSCPGSQRDLDERQPQWIHPDDMEVLSPSSDPQGAPVVSSTGGDSQIRCPSMLHRLLTLPSQLLEGDEESMDALPVLSEAPLEVTEPLTSTESPTDGCQTTSKEEDKAEEDDKGSEEDRCDSPKAKSAPSSGRKSHMCKECGRKFSWAHLLKAHMQTHEGPVRCSQCGKRFSQVSRLQAHLRTHTGKTT